MSGAAMTAERLREYDQAWNDRDVERILAMMTPTSSRSRTRSARAGDPGSTWWVQSLGERTAVSPAPSQWTGPYGPSS